jgi:GNAT superfamily N-acetyltransferase
MQTSVRLAQPRDLLGILSLYRELRPSDPELAETEAHTALARILNDTNLHLVVCEHAGCLAATCMLALVPNLASGARPFGVIEHVVTLSRFRRKGLARLVLRFALDLAWTKTCYKVILLSGAMRTEAHRLYESLGFRGDVERGFVAKPNHGIG